MPSLSVDEKEKAQGCLGFSQWRTATLHQTSIFPARNAFDSMKFLRGSTSSPISVVKIWSAASFVVGDRAFAWDFSVAPMVSHVDLNDIAPPGLLDHRVTAFVARDPHYAAP